MINFPERNYLLFGRVGLNNTKVSLISFVTIGFTLARCGYVR